MIRQVDFEKCAAFIFIIYCEIVGVTIRMDISPYPNFYLFAYDSNIFTFYVNVCLKIRFKRTLITIYSTFSHITRTSYVYIHFWRKHP